MVGGLITPGSTNHLKKNQAAPQRLAERQMHTHTHTHTLKHTQTHTHFLHTGDMPETLLHALLSAVVPYRACQYFFLGLFSVYRLESCSDRCMVLDPEFICLDSVFGL